MTFVKFEPISETEQEIINQVVTKMLDIPLIPCTSCRYCCDGCPAKIKIPDVFNAVNTIRKFPGDNRPKFFYGRYPQRQYSNAGTYKKSGIYILWNHLTRRWRSTYCISEGLRSRFPLLFFCIKLVYIIDS